MGKLTALSVKAALTDKLPDGKAKRLVDGDGLALVLKPGRKAGSDPSRSWVLRIQVAGRRRDFGCGSAERVTLKDARDKATAIRKEFEAGLDPVVEKRKRHAPSVPTFKIAAEALHKELKPSWREGKHRDDWLSSLERHAFPKLGKLTVDQIEGPAIRDALLPIWLEVPETARRVRQRIGAVLDWSHSKGYRLTEAPLRSVTKGLPRQLAPRMHFKAMPWPEIPGFIADMRGAAETMGRLALEFAILTAARSGEVRGAKWSEFDLEAARWTIPASRMKAKMEHVVPLSQPALDIVRKLNKVRRGELVFPAASRHALSDMTLTKVLRDAKVDCTVHGFRSTFRDWVGEQTSFPGEVAEAALAHIVKNPTERAYHRTRYIEKRVALMDAWASFLTNYDNVIELPVRSSLPPKSA